MTVFATAGKPDSFGKRKYPQELPAYLAQFGLNGFEVQCGRGVNVSDEVCAAFAETGLNLSVHSPYFVSLSSLEAEKRAKSIGYILESARTADKIGAERVVVHSGSCAKISREEALGLALETLGKARERLDSAGLPHIILCPELMGTTNQLGNLEEVIALCGFDERMLPCIDFGHLNARNQGEMCCKSALDRIGDRLGTERLNRIHIHFSKIEYGPMGERKHLTFADRQYGPDFEPLMDEIAARGMSPFIVCESDGTQAEDCAQMAEYYRSLL
jgi:deoxyribonuclease-4